MANMIMTTDGCRARAHNGFPGESFEGVTSLICYDPTGIPAVLQTREYARAELRRRFGVAIDLPLARPPANAVCYLHEPALHAAPDYAGPGQLRHLLDQPAQLRIIPARQGWGWARTGFSLVRFDHQPPAVHITADTATLVLDGDEHVAEYTAIAVDLARIALPADASAELINALINALATESQARTRVSSLVSIPS